MNDSKRKEEKKENNRNFFQSVSKDLEEIKQSLEELQEDIKAISKSLQLYITLLERSKNIDNLILNILLLLVGLSVGFALALILFKS